MWCEIACISLLRPAGNALDTEVFSARSVSWLNQTIELAQILELFSDVRLRNNTQSLLLRVRRLFLERLISILLAHFDARRLKKSLPKNSATANPTGMAISQK